MSKDTESKTDSLLQGKSVKELVATLFKDEFGKPFLLTPTQEEIFTAILTRGKSVGKKRLHIMTHTQFGKSDVVSMASLLRVSTWGDKIALIAPSQSKAKIIMGFLIKHIFDNEYFLSRFQIKQKENVESIRRERSKSRLTFNVGNNNVGEIFILSAESKLKSQDVGNSLMGFGAPTVIMDEAALISDDADAKAVRMVGGFSAAGEDFVVKIGNPFTRGHFLEAFKDKAYHKINADWRVGLREKRLTRAMVDEMREKPQFSVMYDNKFPLADEMDAKGWTQLISEEDLMSALVKEKEHIKHAGEKRIGHDVARGGGNDTVWGLRSMNYGEIIGTSLQDNLTDHAARTLMYMKEHEVVKENVFVDAIGVGGGVVDTLRSQNHDVRGVNVSERAIEDKRYTNKRAEAYWRLREWIKKGGKLSYDERWFQLCEIKYKPDSRGRIRIMSKDEMRASGLDSPDVADALMLTFVRSETAESEFFRKKRKEKRKKRKHRGGLHVTMG